MVSSALEHGEQALPLAQRHQDPLLLIDSHRFVGFLLFYPGDLVAARAHFERIITLYDP